MDDTLGFSEQDKKASEDWHLGEKEESTASVGSRMFQQNHDLQVIQKKEDKSDRRIIEATRWEKLAYYRSYATCQTKTQYLYMQQKNFKTYLWSYLFNVFCKTLPSTYVYSFFSAYAPDSHFYVSKILPIARGSTIAFILTALIELVIVTVNTTMYLDYFIQGILFKSPWHRCDGGKYFFYEKRLKCYELREFTQQFVNKSVTFYYSAYVTRNGEYFQLAPIIHFSTVSVDIWTCNNYFCIYYVLLWVGATSAHKLFFKRYPWRILHITQIILTGMMLVAFIHFSMVYFEDGFEKYQPYGREFQEILKNADLDLLSESMTAPPIIHILSARSTAENKPIQDSAIIVTSNAIFYIFRGFMVYILKLYCDDMVKASLQSNVIDPLSFFYLWPIYFSQFYLGDLFGILFFGLNFINEYLIIVITTQCLVEAILSEWRFLKPWMIILPLNVIGITVFVLSSLPILECMYIFCTGVATLMELIIIFYIYPLGRLVDDVTFFSGVRPTKLRILTFWIAPVFYMIKVYGIFKAYIQLAHLSIMADEYPNFEMIVYFLTVPMSGGALYAIYKYVFKLKMGWMQLFKPLPDWGPRDFEVRQLRKEYDSRVYIVSRAPRALSRCLIAKVELSAHQLDIRYAASRCTSQRALLRMHDEKNDMG